MKCKISEKTREILGSLVSPSYEETVYFIEVMVIILLIIVSFHYKYCEDIKLGPGFDSWLYPKIFFRSIGSGTGSTQPHEDNWVAT